MHIHMGRVSSEGRNPSQHHGDSWCLLMGTNLLQTIFLFSKPLVLLWIGNAECSLAQKDGRTIQRKCVLAWNSCCGFFSNVDLHNPAVPAGSEVVLHMDSRYSMGVMQGKFRARENIHRASLLNHLWSRARTYFNLQVVWVKGHSDNYGNHLADQCARDGGDVSKQSLWWDRPFALPDWGAGAFMTLLSDCEQNLQGQVASSSISISKFTGTVVDVALRCGSGASFKPFQIPKDDADSLELQSLTQLRRAEKEPLSRQILSLDICRVRRRIRKRLKAITCVLAVKAFGKSPLRRRNRGDSVRFLKRVDSDGSETKVSCTTGMGDMVTSFFNSLFNDVKEERLPDWIEKEWPHQVLQSLPHVDSSVVRSALLKFKKGKTCSSDWLVVEMVLELDDDVLDLLAASLRERLLNTTIGHDDPRWDEHLVRLLKTKGFANKVEDFRPIAVLPVLYKTYSHILLMLTEGRLEKLNAPQFAFRSGFQAHEVVFILRNIIEKACEWSTPAFILDGDLYKAYDKTKHKRMIEALTQKGVPRIVIAACVREFRRCRSVCMVSDEVRSQPIARTQSLLQGDPSAPAIFNATLDMAANDFIKLARANKWGFHLDDNSSVSLLLFADHFWLLASSSDQLTAMTLSWLGILESHGWVVPIDEATWSTTGPDDNIEWKVCLPGGNVRRSFRNEGFKALGTWITFDNSFERELQERISAAWRAFFVKKELLCCHAAPFDKRVELLESLVSRSLFWCSGSWNLTGVQCSKLRNCQHDMLAKMLGAKPNNSDTPADFAIRVNRKLCHLKHVHNIIDWDRVYHRSVFSWAGHIARMPQYSHQRITYRVLTHKNWQSVQQVAAENRGNQGHERYLRIWRWERPLYSFFRGRLSSWEQTAQDKSVWDDLLEDMVQWRTVFR